MFIVHTMPRHWVYLKMGLPDAYVRGPRVKTCSTSSWLNPLRVLSLLKNRGGSVRDQVMGMLTVGFDSDEGLLADDLFPDEVDALRAAGRQVCEFTKLAVDTLVRSQRVLTAMFHVAFIQAHRIHGCDNLLIEVNPRHRPSVLRNQARLRSHRTTAHQPPCQRAGSAVIARFVVRA